MPDITWEDIEQEFYNDIETGSSVNESFIQWLDRNYQAPVPKDGE